MQVPERHTKQNKGETLMQIAGGHPKHSQEGTQSRVSGTPKAESERHLEQCQGALIKESWGHPVVVFSGVL